MSWILLGLVFVIFCFGYVIIFGAPYLPTLKKQKELALDMLDLSAGQTLVELGSGDGRMLVAAAKRGINSIGYELNPLLVIYSKLICWRYRELIDIRLANFWTSPLPNCDGVYVFLLDKYMQRLNKKITQEISNPIRLVSFAFKITDKKHITENSGLYLYKYDNKDR